MSWGNIGHRDQRRVDMLWKVRVRVRVSTGNEIDIWRGGSMCSTERPLVFALFLHAVLCRDLTFCSTYGDLRVPCSSSDHS